MFMPFSDRESCPFCRLTVFGAAPFHAEPIIFLCSLRPHATIGANHTKLLPGLRIDLEDCHTVPLSWQLSMILKLSGMGLRLPCASWQIATRIGSKRSMGAGMSL